MPEWGTEFFSKKVFFYPYLALPIPANLMFYSLKFFSFIFVVLGWLMGMAGAVLSVCIHNQWISVVIPIGHYHYSTVLLLHGLSMLFFMVMPVTMGLLSVLDWWLIGLYVRYWSFKISFTVLFGRRNWLVYLIFAMFIIQMTVSGILYYEYVSFSPGVIVGDFAPIVEAQPHKFIRPHITPAMWEQQQHLWLFQHDFHPTLSDVFYADTVISTWSTWDPTEYSSTLVDLDQTYYDLVQPSHPHGVQVVVEEAQSSVGQTTAERLSSVSSAMSDSSGRSNSIASIDSTTSSNSSGDTILGPMHMVDTMTPEMIQFKSLLDTEAAQLGILGEQISPTELDARVQIIQDSDDLANEFTERALTICNLHVENEENITTDMMNAALAHILSQRNCGGPWNTGL